MIDTVLNMLFRCSHRRLTRPVTPLVKAGAPPAGGYVVCLDCGKQFAYDTKLMQIGKPLTKSHDGGVIPPDLPKPAGVTLKRALWVSVPLALLAGVVLKGNKPAPGGKQKDQTAKPDVPKVGQTPGKG